MKSSAWGGVVIALGGWGESGLQAVGGVVVVRGGGARHSPGFRLSTYMYAVARLGCI